MRKIRRLEKSCLRKRQGVVGMKCEGLYITCWHLPEYVKHRRLVLNN